MAGERGKLKQRKLQWENTTLKRTLEKLPERKNQFITSSGLPLERIYLPEMSPNEYSERVGLPGEYPYTRGIHATGYRGRLWTTRMFAGFGTAEETNERFKYLLAQGQDGLSTAFDMHTLYGYDADDTNPLVEGEFGHGGVACSSLADMELLFKDIPLDKVSVSMTINSPAAPIWAMFLANARNQNIPFESLRGTLQNDILKEYTGQKEFIFPPEPSMRLVVDTIEYASRYTPQFNPISVSGYHIREAGSTAVQELAFTLADGFAYVDACLKRGMNVNEVGRKITFFFNIHNDFFEEIAKLRAARRIWAKDMKEKYGVSDERALIMRIHSQTSGQSLTAQQPENNVVRVAYQALAAVLGGTQSLHTNSKDEALALPTEEAVKTAVRTQQILKYETGITGVVDPLGGAPFIEALTDQMEQAARGYFKKISAYGGVIPAIRAGFFQREIVDAAFRYQREIDRGERVIVGVNKFQEKEMNEILPIHKIDALEGIQHQIDRLIKLRVTRDQKLVEKTLADLKMACQENKNVMSYLIEATSAYATLGEMMGVMKEVFGEYREPHIV